MRLPRVVVLAVAGLVSLCAVAMLGLFVYVQKPYIEVTELRATSEPQTVQVTWLLGCEEDYYEDVDKQRYLPQVPLGGEPPVLGPVMNPGTRFVLIGYPYTALNRNRITGKVESQRSQRFDVIEWHVVPPYFTPGGANEIESNQPVGWKSAEVPARFFAQIDRRRGQC